MSEKAETKTTTSQKIEYFIELTEKIAWREWDDSIVVWPIGHRIDITPSAAHSWTLGNSVYRNFGPNCYTNSPCIKPSQGRLIQVETTISRAITTTTVTVERAIA